MAINLTEPGTKVFTGLDSPFTNTENLVIEYNDILRPLGFDVMRLLKDSEILNTFINTEPIQNITDEELYEWYINREEANIFANLELNDEYFKDIEDRYEWLEEFLYKEIDNFHTLENGIKYTLLDTLPTVANFDIIKRVFIYTEKYSYDIECEIREKFGKKAKYIYGDFEEVMKTNNIGDSTTYILSDIVKVNTLHEMGIIKFSSILFADNFGYNYDEDDELYIDIEELAGDNLFKIFYFSPEISIDGEIYY